jgi:ABC-2 type transport system ATP-binding protein
LSIGNPADARKIRGLVGLLPEEAGLYPDLSAARTLDFFGRLYQVPKAVRAERIEKLLTMLGLWDRRDAPVRTFSKGMRQRLAIARALIHDPPVLLLDEPTANLDPEGAKTVRDFLLNLRQDKRTILLSTHHLEEADRICDRVGVLDTRLVAVGSPEELRRSLWGRATVVQLATITGAVVEAARKLGVGELTVSGNVLTVAAADPGRDNPELVRAIVEAGGQVRFVTEAIPTLEQVYLKLVGDKQ